MRKSLYLTKTHSALDEDFIKLLTKEKKITNQQFSENFFRENLDQNKIIELFS